MAVVVEGELLVAVGEKKAEVLVLVSCVVPFSVTTEI